jgi:hypothetical protein
MQQPDTPCIIMANEPRAYREVMAAAFRSLRPQLEIVTVEPDELGAYLARHEPAVVVYSREGETVPARVFARVLLYPDGESRATVSVARVETSYADMEFDDLLGVLDRTVALACGGLAPPSPGPGRGP